MFLNSAKIVCLGELALYIFDGKPWGEVKAYWALLASYLYLITLFQIDVSAMHIVDHTCSDVKL